MDRLMGKIITALSLSIALAVFTPKLSQALTPAGVIINNQATATYTDASLVVQSASSNLVQTLVQEVVGVFLTSPLVKAVTLGGLFNFPHFLTNTGNGPESYTVCLDQSPFTGTDDFDYDTLELFADVDQDGQADSATPFPLSSFDPVIDLGLAASAVCYQIPALNGGEAIQLVVEATTPVGGGFLPPDIANFAITAFADSDTSLTDSNTDEGFLTDQPIIEVIKALSDNSGVSPSGPYTVTLTYRNISATDAQNLEISDILPTEIFPVPDPGFERNAGMTYVPGSAQWAHDGAASVVLTDDNFTAQTSGTTDAVFCAYDDFCDDGSRPSPTFDIDLLVLRVASIAAGEEGVLTFHVNIDSDLFESDVLRNVAPYKYESTDAIPITVPTTGTLDSNAVTFVIINAATAPSVVASDSDTDPLLGVDDSDAINNVVSVASIGQGQSVLFDNFIWNTGDGVDTFDITVDNVLDREGNPLPTPFPAGTTFTLFSADGVTPLLDTNANSTPDTGPMNPGEFVKIVLEATPPGTLFGNNSGNGWDVTKIAASTVDPLITNAVTDRLLNIDQSIIDLTNAETYDSDCVDGDTDSDVLTDGTPTPTATGCTDPQGEGYLGGEAEPVNTYNVEAGQSIFLPLWSHNVGLAADNFDLSFSSTNFAAGILPVGWSVRFYSVSGAAGDCSAPINIITNTGPIISSSAILACAEITIAEDIVATGAVESIFFRAESGLSGNVDIKHDAILITQKPLLALEPFQQGQIAPGETISYPHIVANYGNTNLECINIGLVDSLVADGWTSTTLLDVDNDAAFSVADIALTDQSLAPGEQFNIIVQVTAPIGASVSDINNTEVTASANVVVVDGNAVDCDGPVLTDPVTNTTTLTPNALAIVKSQALDANCDGINDTAFVVTPFEVSPGDCVVYQLVATNHGAQSALLVTVNDDMPAFTVYNSVAESCAVTGAAPENCSPPAVAPVNGGTGAIGWTINELLSNDVITATFGVEVE